jgi:hypothetical protein
MNAIEQPALAERLEALDRKLDRALEEVDEIRRIRGEVEELKDDLARVGKDLFRTAATELEDVAPFVGTGDFAALAKRLMRNVNTMNELLVAVCAFPRRSGEEGGTHRRDQEAARLHLKTNR